MIRRIRRALTVLAATALAATVTTPAPSASAATPGPILRACSHLASDSASNRLHNGKFDLTVRPMEMSLHETFVLSSWNQPETASETIWDRIYWRSPGSGPATLLALYCNGDLVLRSRAGTIYWHSNTAGRGVNRLGLTSAGTLVLMDGANRVVWSSGTTSNILPANSVLPSGGRLSAGVLQDGRPGFTWTMQPDGNLVYRHGRVSWQSNTHVPGSRFVHTRSGDLIVMTPAGRAAWHSGSRGSGYSYLWGTAVRDLWFGVNWEANAR